MTELSRSNYSPIFYTAIGDSLTVGTGSGLFSPGYVERFAVELCELRGQQVVPYKFARDGATSEEILSTTFMPQVRYSLRDSQYITITSGGNDLIQGGKAFLQTKNPGVIQQAIQTALTNNQYILQHITDLKEDTRCPSVIYLFNMYNPFPSVTEAEQGIRAYNSSLEQLRAYPQVKIVNIYSALMPRIHQLLSRDDVHPNSEGYAVMAQALLHS